MEGTFNESMLDPGVRQKLVDSLGFCYEHTWQAINLKLSDALGQAILYQDLVRDARRKIEENEQNSGSQLASVLKPLTICPACSIEETTLERVIVTLAAGTEFYMVFTKAALPQNSAQQSSSAANSGHQLISSSLSGR